jgi:tetratricopeptide (TPR) repeat protein
MSILFWFCLAVLFAGGTDDAWLNYGIKQLQNQQYEKAIVSFEKALQINPDNAAAFEYAGKAYLKLGDKSSAIDYYRMAFDLKPSQGLKQTVEELRGEVFGMRGFLFYPVTFEAIVIKSFSFNFGGGAVLFGFSDIFGGGLSVLYHLNDNWVIKSGAMYVPNSADYNSIGYKAGFIDAPFALKYEFWMEEEEWLLGMSFGGYFGFRVFGDVEGQKDSTQYIHSNDYGLYFSFDNFVKENGIPVVVNLIFMPSLSGIYIGKKTFVLNTLIVAGLGF